MALSAIVCFFFLRFNNLARNARSLCMISNLCKACDVDAKLEDLQLRHNGKDLIATCSRFFRQKSLIFDGRGFRCLTTLGGD